MKASPSGGILVRFPVTAGGQLAATGGTGRPLTMAAPGGRFVLEPLFAAPGRRGQGGRGTGMAAASPPVNHQWFVARPAAGPAALAGAGPWDAAHALCEAAAAGAGLAAAGAMPDLMEPDLLQAWWSQTPARGETSAAAAAANVCFFEDQNPEWPRQPGEFAWHLGDRFSQLRTARGTAAAAATASGAGAIRIAHLDTGYDPKHRTFPADQMDLDLQRNFFDPQAQSDASDPGGADGGLRSPGHGAGTLSILAGGRFAFAGGDYRFDDVLGGAPAARIVPVRVANSVVQLSTASVAQAIGYVAGLCADPVTRVDVISMSMGGVASAAWADAANAAYEAGVVFVSAAGNNISAGLFGFPTHQVVYPGRFRRVLAACGVMADRRPYYGLKAGRLQGNWGPDSKMATALSAYTPNVSWARWGCADVVRMNGEGTSSATPQVAAAAALYLQAHAAELFDAGRYPEPWMRVEAVRRALFLSADRAADSGRSDKLGNGILRAADALAVAPPDRRLLQKTKPDDASFSFLRVLTGLGVADSAADRMLQLEATQLAQRWDRRDVPNPLESVVRDPDRDAADVTSEAVRQFLDALRTHPEASAKLKARAGQALDGMARPTVRPPPSPPAGGAKAVPPPPSAGAARSAPTVAPRFVPPPPAARSLRGYAFDPALATTLDTVGVGEITFVVPWEKLAPGPVGEYLEVVDVDPGSRSFYDPVDLDDPMLLAQDGLAPSEGTPQFHQQMAYAVASLTIHHFERALGRRALWRPGPPPPGASPADDSRFVRRLRVYPHALREANAYYSPQKVALLFGYFNATADDPGDHLPGGRVFTCLSHDVVAHETTHALLDGMHRRFLLPSNPDVRAFHEGFADCVALFQHFTFPDIVRHQIANTRGDISFEQNLLGQLATQFGRATGHRTALRDAIGKLGDDGKWRPHEPDPREYQEATEAHARGGIFVAAVFDAFLSIYRRRTADLLRLATGGSGVLRPGAIHPDLVARLADESAKSARHVLSMCIRALDYCPPTDLTFGEFLRAVVTADVEAVPDDPLNYRVSFIEAFRRRGIFPPGVRALGVSSLTWRAAADDVRRPSDALQAGLQGLREAAAAHAYAATREEVFHLERSVRRDLHGWLAMHLGDGAEGANDAAFLGLDPTQPFEVHSARFANRATPAGDVTAQLLVGLLQTSDVPVDPKDPAGPRMAFEGGCTIVANLRDRQIRYCIRKSLSSESRVARQQALAVAEFDSARSTYWGVRPLAATGGPGTGPLTPYGQEPFAMIHRGLY